MKEPSFPTPSGQSLSALEFELACRRSCTANPRRSCAPVQLLVAAAFAAGRDWVPIHSLLAALRPHTAGEGQSRQVGAFLEHLGVAGMRAVSQSGRRWYELRVRCELVDADLPDGRCMRRIADELSRYCSAHPDASPLVGVILSGIHLRQLRHSVELGELLRPMVSAAAGYSTHGRILRQLARINVVQLVPEPRGRGGSCLVYPLRAEASGA